MLITHARLMGMMCHQTAGNDVLSRSSLRGTKQSRIQRFFSGLLRRLAMTGEWLDCFGQALAMTHKKYSCHQRYPHSINKL